MNKILKYVNIIVVFIITLILLSSCTYINSIYGYDSAKYVNIYDYRKININKEQVEITDADINTIISLDMSSSEYYIPVDDRTVIYDKDIVLIRTDSANVDYCYYDYYYEIGSNEISEDFDSYLIGKSSNSSYDIIIQEENDSIDISVEIMGIYYFPVSDYDKIVEFYGFDNMDEVEEFISKRAQEEIIFNYMWEIILNNSKLKKMPNQIKEKINDNIDLLEQEAEKEGVSLNEYLTDLSITIDEINQNLYNFYYEIIVAETILGSQNVIISQADINNKIDNMVIENNITYEEIKNYYTNDDIYYQILMDSIRPILISYIIID